MRHLAKTTRLIFVSLVLFSVEFLSHSSFATIPLPTQLVIGGSLGAFRISATHYNEFYGSPWESLPQIQIGIGLSPSSFVMLKGTQFSREGKFFMSEAGPSFQLHWKQRWLEVGYRRYSAGPPRASRTFMGFGLAFFQIEETPLMFLHALGSRSQKISPKGFYIEIGLEHFFTHSLSLSLDMDLSSAGLYNGVSFQSQSVGGLFVGITAKYFIF